jgi:uncharacterized protein
MRVLVVLALAAIIVFLVRGFLRRRQTPPTSGTSSRSSRQAEPMRQCTHCGAYFPASEAVGDSPDKLFCSDEHRRQHLDSA